MKIKGKPSRANKNKPLAKSPEKATAMLPFQAIVMAGGKGERLSPLTDALPKPLVKVGDKAILEYSILRLKQAGVKYFTFCLNHLAEKIKAHFGNGDEWGVEFEYVVETSQMGTIGGVALVEEFKYDDLLVINADLLTTINFERFYQFFLEEEADLAVATIPYRINLPYGIMEVDQHQNVSSIKEKPTFTYHINTGIYFIRKELLALIPENTPFDAIELVEKAIQMQKKVSSFPLLDYWIDIGKMEDYKKAQEDLPFLNL